MLRERERERETETETEETPMRREACKYIAGKEERINAWHKTEKSLESISS